MKRPDGFDPSTRKASDGERAKRSPAAASEPDARDTARGGSPRASAEQPTDVIEFVAPKAKRKSSVTSTGASEATSGPGRLDPRGSSAAKRASKQASGDPDPLDPKQAQRARRKHERDEIRRFTARSRRRSRGWLVAAGVLVALVVVSIAGAYSPLLAVRTIEVVGTDRVDAAALRKALDDQMGRPLSLVDASEVKAILVRYPLIASYSLESRPPSTLVVRIVERVPVGLVAADGSYTLVDAAGVTIQKSSTPIAGYPVLEVAGGPGSVGFTAAAEVMRALPEELRSRVSTVSASTADDVTLGLTDTAARVVWGSAEDSAVKAVELQRAIAATDPSTVTEYDVSSPSTVVVR